MEPQPRKKRNFIQTIKDLYWALQPVFWSHHPLCDQYKDHTIRLFNKDLCMGCFVGFPSGYVMLFLGSITGLFKIFNTMQLWYIGLVLLSFYFFNIFGIIKSKLMRIFIKILLGFGAAFMIAAVFSYQYPLNMKIMLTFLLIGALLAGINIIRFIKMKRKCKRCEYKGDLKHCPGLSKIIEQLTEKGFSTNKKEILE